MEDEIKGQPGPSTGKEYRVEGFSEVEVSSAVGFEITQSPDYSVRATGDEKLIECLQVEVSGQTLRISLASGLSFLRGHGSGGNVKAVVTMPELKKLSVSGASSGTAKGFKSEHEFSLRLSGAGGAEIDVQAGKTAMTISGAGRVSGELKAKGTELKLSGASRCEVTGAGGDMRLDSSGASQANLSEFQIQNADVDLSGASRASINMNGTLNVDLSGASSLEYAGNAVVGKKTVTGVSKMNQR